MTSIERVTLYRMRVPLTVAYELSIARIEAFDTLLVVLEDADGAAGLGEATVLTGYTHETIDESWRAACGLAERIAGEPCARAEELAAELHPAMPFTATALATAAEMLAGSVYLEHASEARVPMLALVHARTPAELEREIAHQLDRGYRTFKVKAGFDVEDDLARVQTIQRLLAGRAKIRVDANQGYTKEQACRFASALAPDGIELLEQTCAAGDWDAARAVADVATVPMMLDESIYGLDDVDRAAELGAAAYIKFKLMKAGSLRALDEAIARIRAHGMEPVLGNGVACDVGCWMEACIAPGRVHNAGEMNGFLKTERSLLVDPLTVEAGAVVLRPGFVPELDRGAIARYAQDEASFARAARSVHPGTAR